MLRGKHGTEAVMTVIEDVVKSAALVFGKPVQAEVVKYDEFYFSNACAEALLHGIGGVGKKLVHELGLARVAFK